MQSIEASRNYRNSFVCAASILKTEGFFTLWSGAVPRLARLIMSGGIVFTMCVPSVHYHHRPVGKRKRKEKKLIARRYEKSMEILDIVDPQRIYL